MTIIEFDRIKILRCDEHGNGAIETLEQLHQLFKSVLESDEIRDFEKENRMNINWYFYND